MYRTSGGNSMKLEDLKNIVLNRDYQAKEIHQECIIDGCNEIPRVVIISSNFPMYDRITFICNNCEKLLNKKNICENCNTNRCNSCKGCDHDCEAHLREVVKRVRKLLEKTLCNEWCTSTDLFNDCCFCQEEKNLCESCKIYQEEN